MFRTYALRFATLGLVLLAAGCGGGSGGDGADDGAGDQGDPRVVGAAARNGSFGFRISPAAPAPKPGGGSTAFQVDPATQALQQVIPDLFEKRWQASFSMNLTAMTLLDGDFVDVLNGYSQNGDLQFRTRVQGQGGQKFLLVSGRMDNGTVVDQPIGQGTLLPDGFNTVTVNWDTLFQQMRVWVNGAQGNDLTGLDNANQALDFIRFGGVDGAGASTGGTIDFDDFSEQFIAQFDPFVADSGLPAGTSLVFTQTDDFLMCTCPACGVPGGALGGSIVPAQGLGTFNVTGTGGLNTYSRTLQLPFNLVVATGPKPNPGAGTIQTEILQLQLDLVGDPDFSFLSIRAGTDLGLPTPSTGSNTLTENGSRFIVDSFFDITYEIEFTGAPGGPLDGISSGVPTPRTEPTWNLDFDGGTSFDNEIFTDGFESGNTTSWSAVTTP